MARKVKLKYGEPQIVFQGVVARGATLPARAFTVRKNQKAEVNGYNQATESWSNGRTKTHNNLLGDSYLGTVYGKEGIIKTVNVTFMMNPNDPLPPMGATQMNVSILLYTKVPTPGPRLPRIQIIPKTRVPRAQRKVNRRKKMYLKRSS